MESSPYLIHYSSKRNNVGRVHLIHVFVGGSPYWVASVSQRLLSYQVAEGICVPGSR